MGEFELIARLAPLLDAGGDGVVVGPGDDAAVVLAAEAGIVVTVDVLVDGVHFRHDLSSYSDIGWKAVAVSASDIAAMGARPRVAVVGLSWPSESGADDAVALYGGMRAACDRWGLRLVGGDTVHAAQLSVSVTAVGELDPASAVRRSGARPGDRIVVVGALGGAAAALAQIAAGMDPDPELLAAHRRPVALVAAGQILRARGATALIDVSDGFGADLGHICTASRVSARVTWRDLPVAPGAAAAATAAGADPVDLVVGGGEDFALVATLPPAAAAAAAHAAGAAEGVPAAVVGQIGEGAGVTLVCDGGDRDISTRGYDHYDREKGSSWASPPR